jgi:hypothetical protein
MQRRRLRHLALTLGLASVFAACHTDPLYQVDRAIVPNEPGWTLEDMTRAIQRAGARRGWDMRIVKPGLIEGRLRKPSTQAIVDIDYTANEFSIHYKSSENLDHKGGNIHNRYNRWIYNLERDIRREFLRMRPTEIQAPEGQAQKT